MSELIQLSPLQNPVALRDQVFDALKQAITSMDLYAGDHELRLDERKLSEELGVSRTPIRETLARLEQEGFVRNIPRRGAFVVRKTKSEIIEMIQIWAALEGMAIRLVIERAEDSEIAELRALFKAFTDDQLDAHIDEYSNANVRFHQSIIAMSQNHQLKKITDNLFLHLRSIRSRTIHEKDRVTRSIIDHTHIIEAIESRNADLAEKLSREHNLGLAAHVEQHVHWLDD